MRLWRLVPLALCVVACGSSSPGSGSGTGSGTGTGTGTGGGSGTSTTGGGGGNSISCTATVSGQKTCGLETWTGNFPTSDFVTACTAKNGTIGTSCDLTGAVGGCKTTEAAGGITVVTTSWFYFGTTQDIQTDCQAGGGTFVSP